MNSSPDHRPTTRTVVVPNTPDRDGIDAERMYDFLLVALGIVGAAVSGWSIATLLHDRGHMPWGFAAVGVGVYDLLAFMAGLMVYIRRAEPHRAVGAQVIMLGAIGGSAYVNYMHGREIGGDLVALVLGASPVVFEIAFAMRHNVLSVTTAILFPRAMWRRYKDGVWIKLYTGSLPEASGSLPEDAEALPEGSGSVPAEAPPLPTAVSTRFRRLPETVEAQVTSLPEVDSPKLTDADLKFIGDLLPETQAARTEYIRTLSLSPEAPETLAEVIPLSSGRLPEGTEARAEAVAEALRKGDRLTGETVGALYGVSDRTGRDYIRRAKAINAARVEGS